MGLFSQDRPRIPGDPPHLEIMTKIGHALPDKARRVLAASAMIGKGKFKGAKQVMTRKQPLPKLEEGLVDSIKAKVKKLNTGKPYRNYDGNDPYEDAPKEHIKPRKSSGMDIKEAKKPNKADRLLKKIGDNVEKSTKEFKKKEAANKKPNKKSAFDGMKPTNWRGLREEEILNELTGKGKLTYKPGKRKELKNRLIKKKEMNDSEGKIARDRLTVPGPSKDMSPSSSHLPDEPIDLKKGAKETLKAKLKTSDRMDRMIKRIDEGRNAGQDINARIARNAERADHHTNEYTANPRGIQSAEHASKADRHTAVYQRLKQFKKTGKIHEGLLTKAKYDREQADANVLHNKTKRMIKSLEAKGHKITSRSQSGSIDWKRSGDEPAANHIAYKDAKTGADASVTVPTQAHKRMLKKINEVTLSKRMGKKLTARMDKKLDDRQEKTLGRKYAGDVGDMKKLSKDKTYQRMNAIYTRAKHPEWNEASNKVRRKYGNKKLDEGIAKKISRAFNKATGIQRAGLHHKIDKDYKDNERRVQDYHEIATDYANEYKQRKSASGKDSVDYYTRKYKERVGRRKDLEKRGLKVANAGKKLDEAVSRKLIAKKNATKQRVKYVQRKGELPPIMKGRGRYKITNKETNKLSGILDKQKAFRRDAKNATLEKKKGYSLPDPPESSRATSMTVFAKSPLPGEHVHNAQPHPAALPPKSMYDMTQKPVETKKTSSQGENLIRAYNHYSAQYAQTGDTSHLDAAKKAALAHYAMTIAKISHHPGHPEYDTARINAKSMLDAHIHALKSIEEITPKKPVEIPKKKGFLSRLLRK